MAHKTAGLGRPKPDGSKPAGLQIPRSKAETDCNATRIGWIIIPAESVFGNSAEIVRKGISIGPQPPRMFGRAGMP